jgi:hypothetical protein
LHVALSELGRKGYQSFWSRTIANYILSQPVNSKKPGMTSVAELSEQTYILQEDVLATLKDMDVLEKPPRKRQDGALIADKGKVREWAERNDIRLGDGIGNVALGFIDD